MISAALKHRTLQPLTKTYRRNYWIRQNIGGTRQSIKLTSRCPPPSTGLPNSVGSGLNAFNEKEKALENQAVRAHELQMRKKLKIQQEQGEAIEIKKATNTRQIPLFSTNEKGMMPSEMAEMQREIDRLQARIDSYKK